MAKFKKSLKRSRDLRDTTMKLQSKQLRLSMGIVKAERNRMRRFSGLEEIEDGTLSDMKMHENQQDCDSDDDWVSTTKFGSRDSNLT